MSVHDAVPSPSVVATAGGPGTRPDEDLASAVLQAMGDGLIVFSTDGRVERVNDRFCGMTGFGRDALIGATAPFPWWPEGEHDRMRHAIGELERGAGAPCELPLQTADGSRLVVECTPGRVRDAEGRVIAHVVSVRDVTDRRAAEAAVRENEARLTAVLGSMSEGVVVHAGDGRIVMVNDAACRILGLSEDQLRGRTPMDPRWRAVHEDGSPFPGETHPAMVTLRTGVPSRGVLMGVDCPARGDRRWIQINADPFGPPDADGRHSSVVATFADVTDLHRRTEEVRRQRDFTDVVLSAMGDSLLVIDPQHRVALANDRFCEIVGLPREQVVGLRPPFPWWPPELAEGFAEYLANPGADDGAPTEFEVVTSRGERVPVEVTRTIGTHPDGTPGMMLITGRDITRRRAAERSLKDSEERYRTALHASRDGIIIVGADARVRDCNPAARAMLGVDEADLLGAEFGGLGHSVVDEHGAELPLPRRPLMATLATGRLQPPLIVGIDRPRDRRRVWVIESCAPLGRPDDLGRPEGALITLTDITPLRYAQDQLRRSEERYRALFGYQADAVVRLAPDGSVLTASPSIWRVLRIDPNHLPDTLAEHIHPDDLPTATRGFEDMAGGTVGIRFLVRMRRGDGRLIWAEVTGGPVFDDSGALIEVQQSIRDVSERVQMEHDQSALQRVSEIVVAGAPAGVVFARLAQELAKAMMADQVAVLRFAGNRVRVLGRWHDGDAPEDPFPVAPVDMTRGDTAAARVWRTGEPAVVTAPGHDRAGTSPGPSTSVAVPIHVEGWPWGCLSATFHGEVQEGCLARMTRFADLASIGISSMTERELVHQHAETDSLTELANQRSFMTGLAAEIARAGRDDRPLAVIALGLDRFKEVNDRHGHGTGDLALRHVADRLRLMAGADDTIARLGGGEFAWILPDTPLGTAAERAGVLADRITGTPIGSTDLTVTVSLGVTRLAPGDDVTALRERADAALHEAKRRGGHRVHVAE